MLIIIIQFTHFKINEYTSTKKVLVFLLSKNRDTTHLFGEMITLSPPSLRAWSFGGDSFLSSSIKFKHTIVLNLITKITLAVTQSNF